MLSEETQRKFWNRLKRTSILLLVGYVALSIPFAVRPDVPLQLKVQLLLLVALLFTLGALLNAVAPIIVSRLLSCGGGKRNQRTC